MFILGRHQGFLVGRDRREHAFYRSGSTSGLGHHHHRFLMISQYLLVHAVSQFTFAKWPFSFFLFSWKFPGAANVNVEHLLTI